jgi:hypothetical protein
MNKDKLIDYIYIFGLPVLYIIFAILLLRWLKGSITFFIGMALIILILLHWWSIRKT